MTLILRFGAGDVARCRFATSPLHETMSALLTLRDTDRRSYYLPWIRSHATAAKDLDLDLLKLVLPVHGRGPDFLWPTPTGPRHSVDDELDEVTRTPGDIVADELSDHHLLLTGTDRARLAALLTDPEAAREALVNQQRQAWVTLVAPLWPRIVALADAEIATRARRQAERGADGLLRDLHPRVEWDGESLRLTGMARNTSVFLDGRGLVLMPTAFGWPRLGVGLAKDQAVSLTYPLPGMGRLWHSRSTSQPVLERLLGTNRTLVLLATSTAATTHSIAADLMLSGSRVSGHLSILREAGLLMTARQGREVFYTQTALGAALAAAGDPGGDEAYEMVRDD